MNDEERPPTPEELAEADALAQALERDAPAGVSVPDDALGAAALLRRAHDTQSPAGRAAEARRLAAGAARAFAAVDARRPVRHRWRWLAPALLVPASAIVLVLATIRRGGPGSSSPALPAPPVALLETQGRAASGRADLATLDRGMRAYRETLYGALAERTRGGGGGE